MLLCYIISVVCSFIVGFAFGMKEKKLQRRSYENSAQSQLIFDLDAQSEVMRFCRTLHGNDRMEAGDFTAWQKTARQPLTSAPLRRE